MAPTRLSAGPSPFAHQRLRSLFYSEAYMRMIRDDVSQSTRARVHAKLRQIMKRAVRDGMLHENPVIGADAPAMPARDNERYQDRRVTIDDADALMSTLQAEPRSGLRAAIWLAYTMGLRRGEALGLRWSDIDEQRMMVTIHRQMTRHGVVAVKTQASDAELPITAPVLISALRKR